MKFELRSFPTVVGATLLAGIAMVVYSSILFWRGEANIVLLASLSLAGTTPALIIGALLAVRKRQRNQLLVIAAILVLTLTVTHLVGLPLRQAGLQARMRWGETMAERLNQHFASFGSYPETLEELRPAPPLKDGGYYEYWRLGDNSYSLWLHIGYIEAYAYHPGGQWEYCVCF